MRLKAVHTSPSSTLRCARPSEFEGDPRNKTGAILLRKQIPFLKRFGAAFTKRKPTNRLDRVDGLLLDNYRLSLLLIIYYHHKKQYMKLFILTSGLTKNDRNSYL